MKELINITKSLNLLKKEIKSVLKVDVKDVVFSKDFITLQFNKELIFSDSSFEFLMRHGLKMLNFTCSFNPLFNDWFLAITFYKAF